MRYYLLENNEATGPYSKLDLRFKQIRPDALLCPEDAEEWKQAIEIEDLRDLFPGVEKPQPQPTAPETTMAAAEPEKPPEPPQTAEKEPSNQPEPQPTAEPAAAEPASASPEPEQQPETPQPPEEAPEPQLTDEPSTAEPVNIPPEPVQTETAAETPASQSEPPTAEPTATEPPTSQPEPREKLKITIRPSAGRKEVASNKPAAKPTKVQPKPAKKQETLSPPTQEKDEALREKRAPVMGSPTATSLWGQLVKWKWYVAAFAVVVLGALVVSAIVEQRKKTQMKKDLSLAALVQDSVRREAVPRENARQDSIRREEEKKKDPAYIIKQSTDSVRQNEAAIARLEKQVEDLVAPQQLKQDSLTKAQKEVDKIEGKRRRKGEDWYAEHITEPKNLRDRLQTEVSGIVRKTKQKNTEIKTLHQEIARLKQRIKETQSAVEQREQNE